MTANTYTTGTVTITSGSAVVTGSGTLWSTVNVSPGDLFIDTATGLTEIVLSVQSNTQLTLMTPAPAGMAGAGRAYAIVSQAALATAREVRDSLTIWRQGQQTILSSPGWSALANTSSYSASLLDNANAATWRTDLGVLSEAAANGRFVRADAPQGLSATHAAQARANINLGGTGRPSFSALNTATVNTTSGIVPFAFATQNTGAWDTATSRFTAPIAGRYDFIASIYVDLPNVGSFIAMRWHVNGVAVDETWFSENSPAAGRRLPYLVFTRRLLAVGDIVDLRVTQSGSSGAVFGTAGGSFSKIAGDFIG
jgi:hypothetical protein